jgi:ethanolamine utilization protein EutA
LSETEQGGRVFFSSRGRSLAVEDEIRLLSVGVDIGSSTTHLAFSRIRLERHDSRYIVSEREVIHRSQIMLTPYRDDESIDAGALQSFFDREYAAAGLTPGEIDTGALVLTGVAVRRRNARAIGDLFADQAGKMVAVSAGDSLETIMAAFGSGAVARSIREQHPVINVDIGGGTSKIAICVDGDVVDRTAVDIGARVVSFDGEGRVVRVEEAGRWFAADLGIELAVGKPLGLSDARRLAQRMANHLLAAVRGRTREAEIDALLRLEPLTWRGTVEDMTISGGVSEYVYGHEERAFGDLGPLLAQAFRVAVEQDGFRVAVPDEGIRATVIGASQYTTQLSGSTIFVAPDNLLPLRNVPVIAPDLPLDSVTVEPAAIAAAIDLALRRMDLHDAAHPVAVFVRWRGTASFARLDGFCRGAIQGLTPVLGDGRPVVLAGDNDVGGLIGIHLHEEMGNPVPVISIDGLDLNPFDFIDIGEILPASGAVPVVIKSLVFPADSGLGRPTVLR